MELWLAWQEIISAFVLILSSVFVAYTDEDLKHRRVQFAVMQILKGEQIRGQSKQLKENHIIGETCLYS